MAETNTHTPVVVVGADRLITTQQQSAIEHEHPEAKLSTIADSINGVETISIFAGSVSLAEDLSNNTEKRLQRLFNSGQISVFSVRIVAEVATEQYQGLIREKIQNSVLSKYGFEITDLSKQHQFKDDFFDSLMANVENVRSTIESNLTGIIAGVDNTGAYIYEIGHGDLTGHNNIGYAAIGSGRQPAVSEFIKVGYSSTEDFQTATATVTAAKMRAKQARGVGGDMDMAVARGTGTEFASRETVEDLERRQKRIDNVQLRTKENLLAHEVVDWDSRP